ncbi:MAG: asparagine--tRNA ligase [Epsilonproteobacteria bacterium]|nr:asparagine--tRNA ligase [Campylobacterota bacterium]
MMRVKINHISAQHLNQTATVKGWVRSVRNQKSFSFIAINDGSQVAPFQVIADEKNVANYETVIPTVANGCSVSITGIIVQSPGKGQALEMHAQNIEVLGTCDQEAYPLQKKHHTLEFLREISHLRARTNTIGAVARVRNALSFATHKFFQEKNFLYIHTPIVTESDCEGAGELFTVTTLVNKPEQLKKGVNFADDFFAKQAYLTVSGQLNVETYACALSDVYTFGPTFRAENSNTPRHLAEFWMIEPELAFADLDDDMDCAQQYLQYIVKYVLEHNQPDLEFFQKQYKKDLFEQLEHVAHTPCKRLSYTEAIDILLASGKSFEYPVAWGVNLQAEHERYLAEQHCKAPVMVYDYPKEIKSFYMRANEDGKTVAAMDMLVPGIGELIGGSQREERLDVLQNRMLELGMELERYQWYLDLRRFGSVKHAGFGLGLERMVQFATGMENIRDVIPFPRTPKHCQF